MTSPERSSPARAGPISGAAYSPERWRALQRVVDGALDLAPEMRAAYLDGACSEDAALRDDAARLVKACERAAQTDGPFAAPAATFAEPFIPTVARDDSAPTAGRDGEPAQGPDAIGALFAGRYVVERELGRGGTAIVYLARDLRHRRLVAVKVLHPELTASLGTERFLREIELTAGLTHPHILPLHDSGEADGRLYYVMPYVEGETLKERLEREVQLPLGDALRLMREVASALAYAHRRGVVHRDIKPANILLVDGHAVVADFGIARAVHRARAAESTRPSDASARRTEGGAADTLTEVGMSPGTPAYMAPEQARGEAVDERADLYALGVVAYEALAGAHPFGARSPEALIEAHRSETPAPLAARRPDIPPAVAALVARMLAKDPSDRPPSAAAVLRALEVVPPKRDAIRTVRLGAAAVALVTLGVVGYAAWRKTSSLDDRRQIVPAAAEAEATRSSMQSVAVLPFVNTGGDPQDDHFSDGLTDELAHTLAHVPGLRLAGRTSSYAFRGKAVAAQEIGRALKVGGIVTGTVRHDGNRLRVTAQLVSTADGTVRWDSAYESRSRDAFAVQDSLTRAIVAALTQTLGTDARSAGRGRTASGDARRGTADHEAYDLYLQGRYYFARRGASNIARAVTYFRQAVDRDPSFARAHASLAMAYAMLPVYVGDKRDSVGPLAMSAERATALTVASAERAVALDSTFADAQLAIGISLDMRLRLRDALARYRTAVELEPSSVIAHQWLGVSLLNLGQTDEALPELRHASELDPLAVGPANNVGLALTYARRFPEARAAARHALTLDSTLVFGFVPLGLAQLFDGQADSAVLTFERGARNHPEDSRLFSGLLLAYAASGRWRDAERVRALLHSPDAERFGRVDAALADLAFGDREPLIRELTSEAGLRRYVAAGGFLGCNPLLDPLWVDARFRAAMRKVGVAPCALARPWPLAPRASARG